MSVKEQVPDHPTIVGKMVLIHNDERSTIHGHYGKVVLHRADGICTVNVNYIGHVIPWKVHERFLEVIT